MVESLKKLLRPGDLDLIRSQIFGKQNNLQRRNEKSIKDSYSDEEDEGTKTEKKLLRKVVDRKELAKLKSRALRDNIQTILEPGQLDQLKETGIWSLARVKKSEATDPSTYNRVKQLLKSLLYD